MQEIEKLEALFFEISEKEYYINYQIDKLILEYTDKKEFDTVHILNLYKELIVQRILYNDLFTDCDEVLPD